MLFSVDWPFQPDSSLYRQHDQGGRNINNSYTILAKLSLVPDHTGTGLDNTPSADAELRPIDAIIMSLPLSYGEPLYSTNRMASIRNCPGAKVVRKTMWKFCLLEHEPIHTLHIKQDGTLGESCAFDVVVIPCILA